MGKKLKQSLTSVRSCAQESGAEQKKRRKRQSIHKRKDAKDPKRTRSTIEENRNEELDN